MQPAAVPLKMIIGCKKSLAVVYVRAADAWRVSLIDFRTLIFELW